MDVPPCKIRHRPTLPSAAADSTIGPAGGETKKGRPNEWTSLRVKLGTDLLSHPPRRTVPSARQGGKQKREDRKSTRLNSSHVKISYAVFCLKKKKDE